MLQYWRTIIRSGVIGTGIGIIPGVGEDVAAWSSYAAARRASKEKELFGKGSVEGLMAAETGDNACVPGSVIPVLTLAVPGSAPAAVLLAAMLIHGVQPGPLIMINSPQFVFDVVAMMLIASIGILIYGLTLTKPLIKILQVPQTLVMPVIFVLCVVGSFALASRVFDIYVMLFFGIAGFLLRRLNYPDGAAGARHRFGRPAGQESAPGSCALRRRPDAVLHPADQRRAVPADRGDRPAQHSGLPPRRS